MADPDRCPCLSGETYGNCCAPLHRSDMTAPTAERLMRSRFTAFAVNDAGYLLDSWHPTTRPATLELDPDLVWYRLDILSTNGGGPLGVDGTVEFRAYYRSADGRGDQHEVSRFVRERQSWFYLGAV
ncbi:YchJ family protein [Mycetocola sp. CAN_C7]|uniref:YchJ family protein n=1 Tax=Mycetocola sp. CAN_C7 TaxID=2787724 RepID=UPI0018CB623B